MSPDALARLWFGTDEPRPSVVSLVETGSLTADLVDGNLRAICWQRHRGAARGRLCGARPRLGHVRADLWATSWSGPTKWGSRSATKAAGQGAGGAVLHARASIEGRPDGTLVFTVDATPDADFETNRCGFCVLHPIVGLAGSPITVEHVDGTVVSACLPNVIEPWQPFKNLRALTHAVAPGLTATCRMEGDTFEMEDQRNWSDASYKTYVRPLALPWPYRLPAGIAQRQSVTLTLAGDRVARPAGAAPQETTIILGESVRRHAPVRPRDHAGRGRCRSGPTRQARRGRPPGLDAAFRSGRRPSRRRDDASRRRPAAATGRRSRARMRAAGIGRSPAGTRTNRDAGARGGSPSRRPARQPVGRPPVDAARQRLAGESAARGGLRGGPRELPRRCASGEGCSVTSPNSTASARPWRGSIASRIAPARSCTRPTISA